MQRRTTRAAVVIGTLLVLNLSQPTTRAGNGATLKPEQWRIDIGEVRAGEQATATFVLHNPTESAIRIVRAKPS
jgi:hypothetical protein